MEIDNILTLLIASYVLTAIVVIAVVTGFFKAKRGKKSLLWAKDEKRSERRNK